MLSIDMGLETFHSLVVVRRIVNQWSILQQRSYRPRGLMKDEQNKICRHTEPFVPVPGHPFTGEWQTRPDVKKSYERVAWARFGSSSGVNIGNLLPNRDEIKEEWEAEKLWWATLQEMKDDNLKIAKLQERERHSYEKRVAANMAQMPKWIEQWEKDEKKRIESDEVRAMKRDAMTEKALEDFDYKHTADSQEVKEYVTELREKERKEKRLMKKLAKTKLR